MSDHPLDDPVGAALRGPHARLAERHGRALRYPTDVSPFTALPASTDEWDDLARLAGPGATVTLTAAHLVLPAAWRQVWELPGVQLVDDGAVTPRPDPDAVVLTPDDVPEMLDLVERTRPGPFGARTVELGRYLGIREHGALIAMAGERLRPPGWTEISAVCTDPEHRGRGLGTRLILAVTAGIRARGDTAFLHTTAANTTAIRLYEALGFRIRSHPSFVGWQAPGNSGGSADLDQERPSTPARSAHP